MDFLKKILGRKDEVAKADSRDAGIAQTLSARLASALGVEPNVFEEKVSDAVSLDILCFPPVPGRSYWVFATSGMSAERMVMPEGGGDAATWGRAEFLIGLDGAWGEKIVQMMQGKHRDDPAWWPIAAMKGFARYPHVSKVFLAQGHTLSAPGGGAFSTATQMTAALVNYASILPEDAVRFDVPGGDKVTIYGLIFLFGKELEMLKARGEDALFDYLEETGVSEVIYDDRRLCL